MAISCADIAEEVRMMVGDRAGYAIVPSQFIRWMRAAQTDIVAKVDFPPTLAIMDAAPVAISTPVTLGSMLASFPSNADKMVDILGVQIIDPTTGGYAVGKKAFNLISAEEWMTKYGALDTTTRGFPVEGFLFWKNTSYSDLAIQFYPSADLTYSFALMITKAADIADLDVDALQLPHTFYTAVMHFVATRAYTQLQLWTAADRQKALYDAEIMHLRSMQYEQVLDTYPAVRLSPGDSEW